MVLSDLTDFGNNADVVGCGEYVVVTGKDKIGTHFIGPVVVFDVLDPWKFAEQQV